MKKKTTKKRPSGKGKEGHGESHRPRVRFGESQLPEEKKLGNPNNSRDN